MSGIYYSEHLEEVLADVVRMIEDALIDLQSDDDDTYNKAYGILDPIEFYTIYDSKGFFIGAMVYPIDLAGPTIWVDTPTRTIKGTWGTQRAELGISEDIAEFYEGFIKDMGCQR